MSVRTRVFSDVSLSVGDVLRLPDEEGHHLFKVLRARAGEAIEVVDGSGRLFVAELTEGREASVTGERPAPADEGRVTLYQAVPKGRHMDLVVEKATELGVGAIVPIVTEHGVVRLDRGDGKVERWRRVALAAARQSQRLRIPEVREAVPFAEAMGEAGESGVLLHNGPELPPIEDAVPNSAVGLFVGPEGGFSEGELALAVGEGAKLASLGPFRLRSETAGMVAVARACAAVPGGIGEGIAGKSERRP
ncbi:MAG: 16S rRNA (uracil(1498)-N(3))-methyltransferase [Actinomycetota bacterium]|nr:16S rRNA (uracil(1498)-N(3))-methyltransferase [Actinomycetota bacterium]MDP9484271.1 16S rRNA (uracil(1498)-N(3))-methyltransferase [Actinomycetota bacterium]PLS83012.1 MAG: 16S rRNA (uracil(1498)-N(3))-methyltransferase [Actinomycetota bacterium]